MPTTVVSTLEAAMTMLGLLDAWSQAFGLPAHPPDSAGIVTAPNLLSGPLLSQYSLSMLTIDPASVVPTAGKITVTQAGDTGLIVAAFSLTLPQTPKVAPLGMALYSQASGHLWYLAITAQPASNEPINLNWNARITLGVCQGS